MIATRRGEIGRWSLAYERRRVSCGCLLVSLRAQVPPRSPGLNVPYAGLTAAIGIATSPGSRGRARATTRRSGKGDESSDAGKRLEEYAQERAARLRRVK